MKEIWKNIPSRDGYQASNFGNIKSLLKNKDGKILSQRNDKDGYKMVWTKYNSGDRVHRLVCFTFLGSPPEDDYVVNHKNGKKDDNRIENLEWVTVAENTNHSYRTGLSFSSVSENVGVYFEEELISVFNSYSSLSKYIGIDRNLIPKKIKEQIPIFDLLYIKKLNSNENLKENPLFEKEFITNRMKYHNSSPVYYDKKFYESIKDLSEHLGVSRDKISYTIKKDKELNGHKPIKITRYEFITNRLND